MAPTSEAGFSSKDDHFLYEDLASLSSVEMLQFPGDLDNSCETFFCRRNSPLLSRPVIPEPSSTFRKVLGAMANGCEEDEEDIWEPSNSEASSSSSSSSSLSCSSSPFSSKPSLVPSRKMTSATSNFLSVPSSLPSSRLPLHADISDAGAHKTLAGVSLRKLSPRRFSSSCEGDSYLPYPSMSGVQSKRVSWADEKGTTHQLITVRLIRPRLSMDSTIEISATPSHSILRRQLQV